MTTFCHCVSTNWWKDTAAEDCVSLYLLFHLCIFVSFCRLLYNILHHCSGSPPSLSHVIGWWNGICWSQPLSSSTQCPPPCSSCWYYLCWSQRKSSLNWITYPTNSQGLTNKRTKRITCLIIQYNRCTLVVHVYNTSQECITSTFMELWGASLNWFLCCTLSACITVPKSSSAILERSCPQCNLAYNIPASFSWDVTNVHEREGEGKSSDVVCCTIDDKN